MSNFIMIYSRKKFYYENISSDSIDIADIAHALSNICRFGGHVDRFYSVAQHSVIVSDLVPQEHKLAALLHDASEAYLSDIVSPAKRILDDYKKLETKVTWTINRKFGIDTSHEYIKLADRQALYAEAMTFFGTVDDWNIDDFYHKREIEPLGPLEAKELFMKTYYELINCETYSDCCNASIIEDSIDVCSGCFEHCEVINHATT